MPKVSQKPATNGHVNRVGGHYDQPQQEVVKIARMNQKMAVFRVIGTSPYVQERVGPIALEKMKGIVTTEETDKKTKKKNRKPRDFAADLKDTTYAAIEGTWPYGAIPATQFKAAMVAACRLVDFKMTESKQSFYVEADGYDAHNLTPLVRVLKGKPRMFEQLLKNSNGGADVRIRPMWEPGWEAEVRISYDASTLSLADVAQLLMRAGTQTGIGAGRPNSKFCSGCGWGMFRIAGKE